MNHSIALCLDISKLTNNYQFSNVCWLNQDGLYNNLHCPKYKESS